MSHTGTDTPRYCRSRWPRGFWAASWGWRCLLLELAVSISTSLLLTVPSLAAAERSGHRGDRFLVVDCLLPGQVRSRGRGRTYLMPSHPVKTSAEDCQRRGGAYAAPDRSNYATALQVWLPRAKQGDKVAQTYVGEIYEKGLGKPSDYRHAAEWYRKAAEQDYEPAQVNLAHLYEQGRGVERNAAAAQQWNRRASGLKEAIVMDPGTINRSAQEDLERLRDEFTRSKDGEVRLAGPSIDMIEPALKIRDGLSRIPTPSDTERVLIGRVVAPAGLLTFTMNDREQQLDAQGLFHAKIAVQRMSVPVKLLAVDHQGQRTVTELLLVPPGEQTTWGEGQAAPSTAPETLVFGRYHALVIGNAEYTYWDVLETPKNDAQTVAKLLQEKYGFNVKLLVNVSRHDLLKELNTYRAKLTDKDNLLVYYAGHGYLDKKIGRGYWVPIDGELDNPVEWISTFTVTDFLSAMDAKHVLVVADSCYSGALTRSSLARLEAGASEEARQHLLKVLAQKRARIVLASGEDKPVLDIGGGGHSVFARAFLDVLRDNEDVLMGLELYRQVRARVTYAADALAVEQVPQYAPIQFAGHAAGDFLFVPMPR